MPNLAPLFAMILVFHAQTNSLADGAPPIEVVPSSDPLAVELAPVVAGWRSSVVDHDTKRILGFALPEFRDVISRDLKSDDSILSTELYAAGTGLASFLKGAPQSVILRHHDLERYGRGTTTCYYDSSVLERMNLQPDASLIGVGDPRAVRCFFLFFAEGQWFVSFAFAYRD